MELLEEQLTGVRHLDLAHCVASFASSLILFVGHNCVLVCRISSICWWTSSLVCLENVKLAEVALAVGAVSFVADETTDVANEDFKGIRGEHESFEDQS